MVYIMYLYMDTVSICILRHKHSTLANLLQLKHQLEKRNSVNVLSCATTPMHPAVRSLIFPSFQIIMPFMLFFSCVFVCSVFCFCSPIHGNTCLMSQQDDSPFTFSIYHMLRGEREDMNRGIKIWFGAKQWTEWPKDQRWIDLRKVGKKFKACSEEWVCFKQ